MKPTVAKRLKELESRLILPPIERPKKVEEKIIALYGGVKIVNAEYGGVKNLPKLCPGFVYDYEEVKESEVEERRKIVDEEVLVYRKALIDRHLKESLIQREDGLYDFIFTGSGKGLGQLICNITGFTAMRDPQELDKVLAELVEQENFNCIQKEHSLSGKFGITYTQRQTIIDVLAWTEFLAISEGTLNEFYYHLPATDATVQFEINKLLSDQKS